MSFSPSSAEDKQGQSRIRGGRCQDGPAQETSDRFHRWEPGCSTEVTRASGKSRRPKKFAEIRRGRHTKRSG